MILSRWVWPLVPPPPVKSKIRSFCTSTAMRALRRAGGCRDRRSMERRSTAASVRAHGSAAGERSSAVLRRPKSGRAKQPRQMHNGRMQARSAEADGPRSRPAQGRRPAAHATTFTILCGTTITFFGRLPSSARCTASSASTAASISAVVGVARHGDVGALLAVDLHRQRDGVLDQEVGLERRPGLVATSVAWPSAAQHSSARCGIIGWNSRTRMSAASRTAQR